MSSFIEEKLIKYRADLDIPQDAPVVRWRFIGDERSLTPLQDWAINFDPDFSKENAVERINNLYSRGDTGTFSDALVQRLEQSRSGLPDQPYKDDPFELGWRRHFLETLRDPNTTRMTWTTGAVQKDRYNLGKYIDSIDATLQEDGTYKLAVQYKDGHTESPSNIDEFDLEDHVGKELADKIVKDFSGSQPKRDTTGWTASEPTADYPRSWTVRDRYGHVVDTVPYGTYSAEEAIDKASITGSSPKTYSGLDLEMGGKFHEFIYDKKVVQYAKEFLKNYRDADGNKIVPKRISSENAEHLEMIRIQAEQEMAELMRRDVDLKSKEGAAYLAEIDRLEKKLTRIYQREQGKKGDLWYIDTTPEMEEDFIEGMPLTMDTTKEQPAFA